MLSTRATTSTFAATRTSAAPALFFKTPAAAAAPRVASRLIATSAPHKQQFGRASLRMGAQQSSKPMSEEQFDASAKVGFTLDASANGCTGMFWRSRPEMGASASAPDWPRNGTKLQGWVSQQHPGWIKIDHPKGYWLPTAQHGKTIIHFD